MIHDSIGTYVKLDVEQYTKKRKIGQTSFGKIKELLDQVTFSKIIYIRTELFKKRSEIDVILKDMSHYLSIKNSNFLKCLGYDYKQMSKGVKFYLIFEHDNTTFMVDYLSKIPKPYHPAILENFIISILKVGYYLNFHSIGKIMISAQNIVVKDHKFLLIDLYGHGSKNTVPPEYFDNNTVYDYFKGAIFSFGLMILSLFLNVRIDDWNKMNPDKFVISVDKTIKSLRKGYTDLDAIDLLSHILIYEQDKRPNFINLFNKKNLMEKNRFVGNEELINQMKTLKHMTIKNYSKSYSVSNINMITPGLAKGSLNLTMLSSPSPKMTRELSLMMKPYGLAREPSIILPIMGSPTLPSISSPMNQRTLSMPILSLGLSKVLSENTLSLDDPLQEYGSNEQNTGLESNENKTAILNLLKFSKAMMPNQTKIEIYSYSPEEFEALPLEVRPPYRFDDGSVYEGKWKGMWRHSWGILIWPNGAKYEGEWNANKITGQGKIIHANGDQYYGEWKDNLANGIGIYKSISNASYEGSWKNDYPQGIGVETWLDGTRYEGAYKMGKKYGNGFNLFADGSKYHGTFENNKIHGNGTYIRNDGSIFTGEWKNNIMHGKGSYKWPDGSSYEGQYHKGKRNGYGTYCWSDGRKFAGEWVNGVQHGNGNFTDTKGKSREGIWRLGKRIRWCNLTNLLRKSLTEFS